MTDNRMIAATLTAGMLPALGLKFFPDSTPDRNTENALATYAERAITLYYATLRALEQKEGASPSRGV